MASGESKRMQYRQPADLSHQVVVRWNNQYCVTKRNFHSNHSRSTIRMSLSPILFDIFLKKIMQKTFRHPDSNRWMAVLQIIQKKLTPHCRQCPSEDDRIATCSLLTISIFCDALKKNCNNSLKGWRKQLLIMAWKSALTKAKSLSTAPS